MKLEKSDAQHRKKNTNVLQLSLLILLSENVVINDLKRKQVGGLWQ
jgi:hypothetical protein